MGRDGRRHAGRRGHSGRRSLLHAAGADICVAVRTGRSVIDGARQDDVDIAAYVARTVFTVERVVVLDAACVARARWDWYGWRYDGAPWLPGRLLRPPVVRLR